MLWIYRPLSPTIIEKYIVDKKLLFAVHFVTLPLFVRSVSRDILKSYKNLAIYPNLYKLALFNNNYYTFFLYKKIHLFVYNIIVNRVRSRKCICIILYFCMKSYQSIDVFLVRGHIFFPPKNIIIVLNSCKI